MQSSLIGKIEKAKRYAQEPDRITFVNMTVKFRGDNDDYVVNYGEDKWHCTCHFFSQWGTCSHTMTLQRVYAETLPVQAKAGVAELAAASPKLL